MFLTLYVVLFFLIFYLYFNTSFSFFISYDATIATVVSILNTDLYVVFFTSIAFLMLLTFITAFFYTVVLMPSLAVNVIVNIPSSLHVIVVSSAVGAAITHVSRY